MSTTYPYHNPSNPFRVARFIFDGWKDPQMREQFHGSVGYLSEEAAAFRFEPSFKGTGIFFIESESDEQDSVGTVPGSVLRVPFNSEFTSIERVTSWFAEAGLLVHPANSPFLDLTKGLA